MVKDRGPTVQSLEEYIQAWATGDTAIRNRPFQYFEGEQRGAESKQFNLRGVVLVPFTVDTMLKALREKFDKVLKDVNGLIGNQVEEHFEGKGLSAEELQLISNLKKGYVFKTFGVQVIAPLSKAIERLPKEASKEEVEAWNLKMSCCKALAEILTEVATDHCIKSIPNLVSNIQGTIERKVGDAGKFAETLQSLAEVAEKQAAALAEKQAAQAAPQPQAVKWQAGVTWKTATPSPQQQQPAQLEGEKSLPKLTTAAQWKQARPRSHAIVKDPRTPLPISRGEIQGAIQKIEEQTKEQTKEQKNQKSESTATPKIGSHRGP